MKLSRYIGLIFFISCSDDVNTISQGFLDFEQKIEKNLIISQSQLLSLFTSLKQDALTNELSELFNPSFCFNLARSFSLFGQFNKYYLKDNKLLKQNLELVNEISKKYLNVNLCKVVTNNSNLVETIVNDIDIILNYFRVSIEAVYDKNNSLNKLREEYINGLFLKKYSIFKTSSLKLKILSEKTKRVICYQSGLYVGYMKFHVKNLSDINVNSSNLNHRIDEIKNILILLDNIKDNCINNEDTSLIETYLTQIDSILTKNLNTYR